MGHYGALWGKAAAESGAGSTSVRTCTGRWGTPRAAGMRREKLPASSIWGHWLPQSPSGAIFLGTHTVLLLKEEWPDAAAADFSFDF